MKTVCLKFKDHWTNNHCLIFDANISSKQTDRVLVFFEFIHSRGWRQTTNTHRGGTGIAFSSFPNLLLRKMKSSKRSYWWWYIGHVKKVEREASLMVQRLRLRFPMQGLWVWSLYHTCLSAKKTKIWNRGNIATNSIKTLKMVYVRKSFKKWVERLKKIVVNHS